MTNPIPGGQVTTADLFRVLSAIQSDLRAITGDLRVAIVQQAADHQSVGDHESRLRIVETNLTRIKAIAITVSSIAGVVAGAIAGILSALGKS